MCQRLDPKDFLMCDSRMKKFKKKKKNTYKQQCDIYFTFFKYFSLRSGILSQKKIIKQKRKLVQF